MILDAGVMLLIFGACAYSATPTVFASLSKPNGLAATQSFLLATSQDNTSEISKIDSGGTVSHFATLPAGSVLLQEVYLAISPGLGGFAANVIYACRGNKVFQISTDGLTVSTFHDFSLQGVADFGHCGITFDEQGTFSNSLIVTFQNGTVYKLNSAGVPTLLSDSTKGLHVGITEGPQVTPSTFTPAPNKLLVTQEDFNQVFSIDTSGTATLLKTVPDPESTQVIPATVCSFGTSNGAFFTAAWDQGKIYKYPPSDFTGLGGSVLVPLEGFPNTANQGIDIIDKTSGALGVFDTLRVVHEGSTFVSCPRVSHCTLTQGGYKNNFNNLVTALKLGNINYTQAQVNSILQNNAVQGNGLISLAHQLITAKLNIFYGTIPSAQVTQAISDADTLIDSLVIPPVGSGFLSPSSTSNLESILDAFNNSNECQ
jgi:hypothetical protein